MNLATQQISPQMARHFLQAGNLCNLWSIWDMVDCLSFPPKVEASLSPYPVEPREMKVSKGKSKPQMGAAASSSVFTWFWVGQFNADRFDSDPVGFV